MIIDTNINLSRWPFRRLAGDETPDLVAKLRKRNVVQAWAGSFDGILHKDIGGVNARLAAECSTHGKGILAPFGSIKVEGVDKVVPLFDGAGTLLRDANGNALVRHTSQYVADAKVG